MKVVALIPVKLGSKRVPFKNIKPFYDGTPLITFIQRVCLKSKYINEIYIYCSDDEVKPYVLDGVKFLKRPEILNGDNINANDIIKQFMKEIDADIYVNTHTTSPFANPLSIDECIEKVMSDDYDSAFCAQEVKTFLWDKTGPINFDPNNFPRTQDLPLIYGETSIAYVFTKQTFLKFGRRVGIKPFIKTVGKIESMDIDYPEDFEICDAIYKKMKSSV